jgi:hypothetical protein
VVASNGEAVVFLQGGERLYGCLKELGVTRLLLDMNTQSNFGGTLIAVRLAGRFAALDTAYFNQYVGDWEYATLYDLSSGKATQLARVGQPQGSVNPSNPGDGLDSLVLDSSGFAAWRRTSRPLPHLGALTAMSCPSASLCVAGDAVGNILTSSDPAGGPDAWSIAMADPGQGIVGVSCPSVSMCVAADFAGNILVSTDPTGGQSGWTKTKIETGTYPDEPALSHARRSRCASRSTRTATSSLRLIRPVAGAPGAKPNSNAGPGSWLSPARRCRCA